MSTLTLSKTSTEILDLYKMAVEMADRMSARRGAANSYFLTIQTTLIMAISLTQNNLAKSSLGSISVGLAGLALSGIWWLQLKSYRDLNRAKFVVINEIEKELPVRVFTDEWTSLKQDKTVSRFTRYVELGASERKVPLIFALLHATLFIGRLLT